MADRIEMLVGTIDLATARGLELGPLAKPVVAREHGDIRYLDHVDTDTLRARYSSHVGMNIDDIVEIDYAIGDRTIGDVVGADAPFDYVVASHVIEHVPDLIGWLGDLRSIMRDDGVLSLAVPDHRRCFDTLRSPTVVADVVHAHLTDATVPSPRQVFDHYSSAVTWRGSIEWPFEPPFDEVQPVHSEQDALQRATAAGASGEYDDVHCWVFTPRSFRRVISALQRMGLVSFRLDACSDSMGGEFFARLTATTTADARANTPSHFDNVEGLRAAEAASVRAELAEAQRQLAAATAELAAMEQSRSWRLTAPLRSFNARRRQRGSGRQPV